MYLLIMMQMAYIKMTTVIPLIIYFIEIITLICIKRGNLVGT